MFKILALTLAEIKEKETIPLRTIKWGKKKYIHVSIKKNVRKIQLKF